MSVNASDTELPNGKAVQIFAVMKLSCSSRTLGEMGEMKLKKLGMIK